MGIIEENGRRKFVLAGGYDEEDIREQKYIGDFRHVFTFKNGQKVLYDELTENRKFIQPRNNEVPDLTDEEWLSEFSIRLKNKLVLHGLTRKEFSELLNIPYVTTNNYVNGKRMPSYVLIRRMCRIFNCRESDLTDFDYLL